MFSTLDNIYSSVLSYLLIFLFTKMKAQTKCKTVYVILRNILSLKMQEHNFKRCLLSSVLVHLFVGKWLLSEEHSGKQRPLDVFRYIKLFCACNIYTIYIDISLKLLCLEKRIHETKCFIIVIRQTTFNWIFTSHVLLILCMYLSIPTNIIQVSSVVSVWTRT